MKIAVATLKKAEVFTLPTGWNFPDPNTPVTFRSDGSVASVFGDVCWDFSAYTRAKGYRAFGFFPELLNCDAALAEQIVREQKALILALYRSTRNGKTMAFNTLKDRVLILRDVSRYAASHGFTPFQVLQSETAILHYAQNSEGGTKAIRLHGVLAHLFEIDGGVTKISVPFYKVTETLIALHRLNPASNQTAPIPPRIYCEFIARLEEELLAFEKIMPSLCKYVSAYLNNKSPRISKKFAAFLVGRGLEPSYRGIDSLIPRITSTAALAVSTFSGMRFEEVTLLPFDCLSYERDGSRTYSILKGITPKLHGPHKRATWVTSPLGVLGVRIMQQFSGTIHALKGDGNHEKSTDGSHLLLCRVGHVGANYVANLTPGGLEKQCRDTFRALAPVIDEEDLDELTLIDPFRGWDEELEVGTHWPFSHHQLRRSLALYAHASGLVSIPTLKRQLQHILAAMSAFYADGSAYIPNILDRHPRDKHISQEWREAQAESEFLGMAKNVFLTDEKLFGGFAHFAKERMQDPTVEVFTNREETMQMFRRGELRYKETVLGGCTSIEPCKLPPLEWLPLDCLEKNCKHLVGSPARLRRVVVSQERVVAGLAATMPDSDQFRLESHILERLKAAERKYVS